MSEQGSPGAQVTGAQSLVRSLEAAGVEVVFGIPGGAILPAYDPLFDSSRIRHILVRHEQGAGHAAQGYAAGHRPGRRLHGDLRPRRDQPGHPDRRRLHGLGADRRRSPARSPARAIGTDAFQEADIRGITMPITKHNFLVTDPDDIPRTIAEAFHIASTGRPGPVLVDIAKDALQAMTTFAWPTDARPARLPPGDQAARASRSARRPG